MIQPSGNVGMRNLPTYAWWQEYPWSRKDRRFGASALPASTFSFVVSIDAATPALSFRSADLLTSWMGPALPTLFCPRTICSRGGALLSFCRLCILRGEYRRAFLAPFRTDYTGPRYRFRSVRHAVALKRSVRAVRPSQQASASRAFRLFAENPEVHQHPGDLRSLRCHIYLGLHNTRKTDNHSLQMQPALWVNSHQLHGPQLVSSLGACAELAALMRITLRRPSTLTGTSPSITARRTTRC